ncbi:MAG: acyl carrier protein, partial [Burkholderiales bacterium]
MSAMTREQIRTAIFEVLGGIAPEIEPDAVRGDEPLRDQVDLDSFDFLNVIIALNERLHVAIPEADYGKLLTLNGMLDYLG